MAASASDAHPFPIYNARYRVIFPLLDADGDLVTGASTPDSEISQDCGTFADATNEMTEIATSSGMYYLDLIATEMDTKSTAIIAKSATAGMKTTPLVLYPVRLPVIRTGTAQAGGASSITLDSGASAITDYYVGCYVNITNNSPANALGQARMITAYNGSTKVATVEGTYGTNPSSASTFEILATELWIQRLADVNAFGGVASTQSAGRPEVNTTHVGGTSQTAGDIIGDTNDIQSRLPAALVSGRMDASVGAVAANAITAAGIADGAIDRATFAADTGLQTVRSNTAQAGAAGTITLDASASASDDFYNDCWVFITGGTGVGQARLISDYVGSTKVASVVPNWVTNPDATSTFAILPNGRVDVGQWVDGAPNALVSGRVDASVGNMASDVVTAAAIATAAIDADALAADAITAAKIATGAIDADAIAADAITAAKIASGAIDRDALAADTGLQPIRSNTAQAGAAGSITLDASASATDDFYNDNVVLITGGTGVGQVRRITDYVGSTKVATVKPNWTTNPDATSTFAVLPAASVWDEVLADHLDSGSTGAALNAAGAAGDPWQTALPGAYGAGTAGKIVGDNVNATISSRATQTSVDTIDDFVDTEVAAIKAKTDQLTFTTANKVDAAFNAAADFPQAAADKVWSSAARTLTSLGASLVQEIWDRATSALTTAGSIGKLIVDNLNATVSSRQATLTSTENNAIADALLKRDLTAVSGEASRSPLNALRFLRNKWSISAGTLTVKKEDDSTTAWTGSVTTTAGNPVSEIDPS